MSIAIGHIKAAKTIYCFLIRVMLSVYDVEQDENGQLAAKPKQQSSYHKEQLVISYRSPRNLLMPC